MKLKSGWLDDWLDFEVIPPPSLGLTALMSEPAKQKETYTFHAEHIFLLLK